MCLPKLKTLVSFQVSRGRICRQLPTSSCSFTINNTNNFHQYYLERKLQLLAEIGNQFVGACQLPFAVTTLQVTSWPHGLTWFCLLPLFSSCENNKASLCFCSAPASHCFVWLTLGRRRRRRVSDISLSVVAIALAIAANFCCYILLYSDNLITMLAFTLFCFVLFFLNSDEWKRKEKRVRKSKVLIAKPAISSQATTTTAAAFSKIQTHFFSLPHNQKERKREKTQINLSWQTRNRSKFSLAVS